MPVFLKDTNDFSELERFGSVLIVPCRFCLAASLAVRRNALAVAVHEKGEQRMEPQKDRIKGRDLEEETEHFIAIGAAVAANCLGDFYEKIDGIRRNIQ